MTALLLRIDGSLIKVTDGKYVGWLNYIERVVVKFYVNDLYVKTSKS